MPLEESSAPLVAPPDEDFLGFPDFFLELVGFFYSGNVDGKGVSDACIITIRPIQTFVTASKQLFSLTEDAGFLEGDGAGAGAGAGSGAAASADAPQPIMNQCYCVMMTTR